MAGGVAQVQQLVERLEELETHTVPMNTGLYLYRSRLPSVRFETWKSYLSKPTSVNIAEHACVCVCVCLHSVFLQRQAFICPHWHQAWWFTVGAGSSGTALQYAHGHLEPTVIWHRCNAHLQSSSPHCPSLCQRSTAKEMSIRMCSALPCMKMILSFRTITRSKQM